MIKLIEQKEEFLQERKKFNNVFNESVELPENVYKDSFKIFIAFEFDLFFWEFFFFGVKEFVKGIGDLHYTYYVVDPSPENFFYYLFKKYGVGIIDIESSIEEYNEFLSYELRNKKYPKYKDDLLETPNVLTLFSSNPIWGLYAARSWEIGVVGFVNEDIKTIFLNSFNERKKIFTTIASHIQDLDGMLHFPPKIKKRYEKLLNNLPHLAQV